jgi:hypothetical protein
MKIMVTRKSITSIEFACGTMRNVWTPVTKQTQHDITL